jgi:hypothetical protein
MYLRWSFHSGEYIRLWPQLRIWIFLFSNLNFGKLFSYLLSWNHSKSRNSVNSFPTRKYCSGDRKVLVFGAPKIMEIFKKLAFWHSLVSPRVLSRETWEKIRARGLRTLTEFKISLFGPLCSVRITKNYISNCSFFAHSYNFFIHFRALSHQFGSSEKSLQKRSGSDSISYWALSKVMIG